MAEWPTFPVCVCLFVCSYHEVYRHRQQEPDQLLKICWTLDGFSTVFECGDQLSHKTLCGNSIFVMKLIKLWTILAQ